MSMTVARRSLSILAVVLAVGAATPALGEAAPDREARMIAGNCLLCHGEAASAAGGIPTLKGQDPKVIATAMRAFRDGQRHGTIMPRIAKGYDDGVIDALSAYLAQSAQ